MTLADVPDVLIPIADHREDPKADIWRANTPEKSKSLDQAVNIDESDAREIRGYAVRSALLKVQINSEAKC